MTISLDDGSTEPTEVKQVIFSVSTLPLTSSVLMQAATTADVDFNIECRCKDPNNLKHFSATQEFSVTWQCMDMVIIKSFQSPGSAHVWQLSQFFSHLAMHRSGNYKQNL